MGLPPTPVLLGHGAASGETVGFPAWTPHPDVWLVLGLLVAAYVCAAVRLGPRHATPGRPAVTTFQKVSFGAGVAALWLASDWPLHDLGEGHLLSVHMVEHVVEMLVVPPLLLMGTPAWMARALLRPPRLLRTVRWWARFVPATIAFNVAVLALHTPLAIDVQVSSEGTHLAAHALLLAASILMWLPVLSPLPEVPRLSPPLRMIYLFVQGILPTVPASFLTFGDTPLYHAYAELPRLWGISVLDDMRVGGLIMKIGAGAVLWVVISIVFFRWYAEEQADEPRVPPPPDLDRELQQMGLAR